MERLRQLAGIKLRSRVPVSIGVYWERRVGNAGPWVNINPFPIGPENAVPDRKHSAEVMFVMLGLLRMVNAVALRGDHYPAQGAGRLCVDLHA